MERLNGKSMIAASNISQNVGIWRTDLANYDFAVEGGVAGAYNLFTVTGTVYCQIVGVCVDTLTSGGVATIEVGIAGNTAILIPQTTATDLDQYETWQDATPEANPGAVTLELRTFQITNGADIIFTIGTADLTAGSIDFLARWFPVSTDGLVIAAT